MSLRYYLSPVAGDGLLLATAFHPILADLVPGAPWGAADGRASTTVAAGVMLVIADVTDAQHAAALAGGITYLPMEREDGSVVPPSGTIGEIAPANRLTVRDALAVWNFDSSVFALYATLGLAIAALQKQGPTA